MMQYNRTAAAAAWDWGGGTKEDTVWQTPWTSLDVLDSMLSVCLFSDALWSCSLSGVCLGMQVAVIEFARNVLGWGSKSYTSAHSLSHSHSLWVNLFDGMGYLCGGTFFWKHWHWYTPLTDTLQLLFIPWQYHRQSYSLNCVHLLLFVSHQVPTRLNSMQTLNDQWWVSLIQQWVLSSAHCHTLLPIVWVC